MSTTTPFDAKRSYLDLVANASDRLPGQKQAWVRALREQALARFTDIGFPTPADEGWKYTNVAPLLRQSFAITDSAATTTSLPAFGGLATHRLVVVNGRYNADLSTVPALPAHGYAGSLAAALSTRADELEGYLGRLASNEHGFAALNTALLVDGVYLRIPAGVVIEQPIHIIYINEAAVLAAPRALIVAEAGSQATIIEHYVSPAEARYLTNALTEVVLERGAIVEHYRLQQESSQAFSIGGLHVAQATTSRFASHAIDFGGLLVRNEVRTTLAEGAECSLNGLYVVDGRQHVDNHTLITHAKPRAVSRELYKGVLEGRARAVFNGKVIVQADAQQTDAQQMNNNLLLSEDAEIDTKPEFEIYADDVKCSHGATVGQLDLDALFYLRSRAVDDAAARDLLTYAFAHDILNRFSLAPVRIGLEKQLLARLLHGREIKEVELV